MNKLKTLLIIAILIIIGLVIFIFKDNLFHYNENRILSEYEKVKNKPVLQMTESEWNSVNEYILLKAKQNNTKPDTVSYQQARLSAQMEELKKALNNPCSEPQLVKAFHEMMEFNMPYEKYEKNSIKVIPFGDCSIRINVTTHKRNFEWKTFWVFEVYINESIGKYELKRISSEIIPLE